MQEISRRYATIGSIGDGMPTNSVIPSPIFETLRDSEDTLRTTLAELAEDKRKQRPNISERKLAEYLADQMGYRGAKNVEALVASRERIAKSRQAVGLSRIVSPQQCVENVIFNGRSLSLVSPNVGDVVVWKTAMRWLLPANARGGGRRTLGFASNCLRRPRDCTRPSSARLFRSTIEIRCCDS